MCMVSSWCRNNFGNLGSLCDIQYSLVFYEPFYCCNSKSYCFNDNLTSLTAVLMLLSVSSLSVYSLRLCHGSQTNSLSEQPSILLHKRHNFHLVVATVFLFCFNDNFTSLTAMLTLLSVSTPSVYSLRLCHGSQTNSLSEQPSILLHKR